MVFPSPSLPTMPARRPAPELTGCPWHDVKAMLRQVGLRPTRQRMALGWLLFGKGDRHLTAEMLYEEATRAKVPVSLATIYNTLHQFTEVGLLRQVAVDGSKAYFDTNASEPSSLLHRRRRRVARYPERRGGGRQDAAAARRLSRSRASTWSCGCGGRAEVQSPIEFNCRHARPCARAIYAHWDASEYSRSWHGRDTPGA